MHPDSDALAGLLLGTLSEDQADDVAEHVEHCSTCAESIRELESHSDDLIRSIRQAPVEHPLENEPECHSLLDVVATIGVDRTADTKAPSLPNAEFGKIRDNQLVAELGRGGMGTVYKALHERLDKFVALKVLRAERMEDTRAVDRFAREMKAVGRLSHPNIVGAHDAGESAGTHFLVMEFIDGADLSTLVRQLGPLRIADACELIREAAIGLEHAREHGLVHRDIKPSNLMITRNGQLKILDLGLARLHNGPHGELTTAGQIIGTLDYMAPEQTDDSHEVDIRADVYGLGATLFKLLCGRAPYAGAGLDTVVKKLRAMTTQPVPSIGELRTDTPADLDAIVSKMLAKEASDRFASPRELADALAPFTSGSDLAALAARFDYPDETEPSAEENASSTAQHPPASMTETRSVSKKEVGSGIVATTIDHQPGANTDDTLGNDTVVKPGVQRSAKRRWLPTIVIAALAVLLTALAVITIQTDKGTIKIVSFDPALTVMVRRNGKTVDGFQVEQRRTATSYYSGQYEIEIVGGKPDGVRINRDRFQLTRGKDVIVEITQQPAAAAAAAPEVTPPKVDVKRSGSPNRPSTDPPSLAVAPFDRAQAQLHQKAWAERLGVPVESAIELPGGVKLTLVLIPPGEFKMGSNAEDETNLKSRINAASAITQRNPTPEELVASESPQHVVRITRPFFLGRYEVTQGQWEAVTGDNPSSARDHPSLAVTNVDVPTIESFPEEVARGSRTPGRSPLPSAVRSAMGVRLPRRYGNALVVRRRPGRHLHQRLGRVRQGARLSGRTFLAKQLRPLRHAWQRDRVVCGSVLHRLLHKVSSRRPQRTGQFRPTRCTCGSGRRILARRHPFLRAAEPRSIYEDSLSGFRLCASIEDPNRLAGLEAAPAPAKDAAFAWPEGAPAPASAPLTAQQAQERQAAWAKYLELPVERSIELADGVQLTMRLIPPGEFQMGLTKDEQTRLPEARAPGENYWQLSLFPATDQNTACASRDLSIYANTN